MKKNLIVLLIVSMIFLMLSCEKTPNNILTSSTPWNSLLEPVKYEDLFESFMEFPQDRGYFFGKVMLNPQDVENGSVPLVFFRVLDIEPEYSGDFSIYKIQFVDTYGLDYIDTEKIYRMGWRGHKEKHLYGRPPLEIGKIYARFIATSSAENLASLDLLQAGLIYDVKEEADGKRYLYGYGVDLYLLNCKIPITDPEENNIYKVGKHDKVIAKLKELGQPIPTFDYKAEAEALFKEYSNLES